MHLRNHPKINWLFGGSGSYSGAQPRPTTEEDGILKDVKVRKNSGSQPYSPDHLCLTIEFQGHDFTRTLLPKGDHPDFVARLCDELKAKCLGMSIREIGDLGIDF